MSNCKNAFSSLTILGLVTASLIATPMAKAQRGGPSPVRVAKVVSRRGAVGLPFVGTTRPSRRSIVGSAVAGRVQTMHKEEGDFVKELLPLVQLRTKTISIQLAVAKAEEKLRMEELKELKAGSRHEEKQAAKARLDATKALQAYAKAKFARTEALFRTNRAATQEEFDEALSAKLAAEFGQLAAKANYDLTLAGERQEKIDQADARLLIQQQQVAQIVDVKSKYEIKAPFDGYVIRRFVEVGNWVNVGDPVVEVVALDPIEIDVKLPEVYISKLKVGSEVSIQFDALSKLFVGKVHRIVPEADSRSRSFPVRIRLLNPKGSDGVPSIKAGMLARVQLPVGKPRGALFVRGDALVLEGERKSVFVVRKTERGLTVIPVPVRVGIADGELREVSDEQGVLRAGVEVVIEGNERLRPGQPIKILK